MELLSFEDFLARTILGWPLHADMSIYAGMPFECACGSVHEFSGEASEVARELPHMRFVFRCPQRVGTTCVHVKGLINVELVSEFGCRYEGEDKTDEKVNDDPQPEQRMNKNLYSILGVLPTAEDVVIRAAYKALAQRYHPDRYQGSKAEADELMKELNAAYAVLSDPEKRRQYDVSLKAQSGGSYESEAEGDDSDPLDEAMSALEDDWQIACKFYPDLQDIYARLRKVNSTLATMFKATMLEFKAYQDRVKMAARMEDVFLSRYFGSNPTIVAFAKKLIYETQKQAARALNRYINVMGDGVPADQMIIKVREEFNIPDPVIEAKRRAEAAERARREKIEAEATVAAKTQASRANKRNVEHILKRSLVLPTKAQEEEFLRAVRLVKHGDVERMVHDCPSLVISAKDSEGNAGLHLAAIERSDGLVKLLLQWGADKWQTNSGGLSPMTMAMNKQDEYWSKVLRDYVVKN